MTLRDWIYERRLTQAQVAEMLDIHEVTLNRWINGRAIPRRKHMLVIAMVTGGAVRPADFYGEDAA